MHKNSKTKNTNKDVKNFLKQLTQLTNQTGIVIEGCGSGTLDGGSCAYLRTIDKNVKQIDVTCLRKGRLTYDDKNKKYLFEN